MTPAESAPLFHNATSRLVVRMAGARHFGYEVACSCGWKCLKHYSARAAGRCATQHENDRDIQGRRR